MLQFVFQISYHQPSFTISQNRFWELCSLILKNSMKAYWMGFYFKFLADSEYLSTI